MIRVSCTTLLNTSPNSLLFKLWFKPSLLSKILVKCHHTGYDFWSSILRWLCPTKVPSSKILDHVIVCDFWFELPPLSKILATPVVRLQICSFFSHLYSISLIYVTVCICMNWKCKIKKYSFTVHLFLEVLDHGFQPQNAPTDSQRWINCFRDSAVLISLTVLVCMQRCTVKVKQYL